MRVLDVSDNIFTGGKAGENCFFFLFNCCQRSLRPGALLLLGLEGILLGPGVLVLTTLLTMGPPACYHDLANLLK